MKRDLLIMFLLASLLVMTGCSQENIPGGDDGVEDAQTSYLAINLRPADESSTRAANGYEDGTDIENHVEKVRFYFFNAVGGIANVSITSSGGYVNYYDWTPGTAGKDPNKPDDPDNTEPGNQVGGTDSNDDIESKLTATIVINTAKGDKVPNMVAAVINPPADLGTESMSLTQLKEKVDNYASDAYTERDKFVMFNSIFVGDDGDGAVVINQSGEKKNLWTTAKDAKAHPVTIYVERSVAKVRVTLGSDVSAAAGSSMLALKDKEGQDLKVGGEQVYLKLEGWGLTADINEGRLVKKINRNWPESWWKGTHRCFWAINSMTAANRYHNYTNSINNSLGTITSAGESQVTTQGDALYTNENAQLNDIDGTEGQAKNHTKVILKGTLCKKNGSAFTAFTIVRHLGTHFADNYSETEANNLNELKKSILNQLSAKGYKYYTQDGSTRRQIDERDLKITTATKIESENSKNNCYVYAQLTTEAEGKTWYTSLDGNTTADKNVINDNLKNKDIVDWALVWRDGMTYYYYEIKHLGNQIGVVRNHVYDTTVTKIAGLGTPVYDPEQIIYPEKPDPNDHFIAAQIMILSWRIVPSDNVLEW